jgi:ABC-type oligopeptide transport system ATPase subunit
MMMKILETKSLKKYYGKGANLVKAVDGVDLSGDFLINGGCGCRLTD